MFGGVLVGFALLIVSGAALEILKPQEFQGYHYSPIPSSIFGSQDLEFVVSGEVAFVAMSECEPGPLRQDVRNKVVFLFNDGNVKYVTEQERIMYCVQLARASAVVHLEEQGWLPGYGLFFNEAGLNNGRVTLPIVQIERKLVDDILEARPNMTVVVTPDENRWLPDCYDSAAFLIVMQIGLVVLNAFGVITALQAMLHHLRRIQTDKSIKDYPDVWRAVCVMTLGSFLLCVACIMRCVYCAMGPVFSTSRIYLTNHLFMIYTTSVIDTVTTVFAAVLFLNWGAFGGSAMRVRRILEMSLLVFGLVAFVLIVVTAYIEGRLLDEPIGMIVTVSPVVVFLIQLILSLAFLFAGVRFVRQLRQRRDRVGGKQDRSLRKAVIWVAVSGGCLLVQLGAFGSRIITHHYDPADHFAISALIFYGVTLSGISQALAFRPITELPPIHVCCWVIGRVSRRRVAVKKSVVDTADVALE